MTNTKALATGTELVMAKPAAKPKAKAKPKAQTAFTQAAKEMKAALQSSPKK